MLYLGFRKVGIPFSAHILCTCAEDLPAEVHKLTWCTANIGCKEGSGVLVPNDRMENGDLGSLLWSGVLIYIKLGRGFHATISALA